MSIWDKAANFVSNTYKAAKEGAKQTYKKVKDDPLKLARDAALAAATAGTSLAYSTMVRGEREQARRADEEMEQSILDESIAMETADKKASLKARNKALEEERMRRRMTPGRPIFSSLNQQQSLLG
jgi:hypothetical protein